MISEIFGYKFSDPKLLETALTHPSMNNVQNYQTLEFLGDRVLDLAIAEYLYEKFPDEQEGDLSKRHIALVCGSTMAMIAKEQGVGDLLVMSGGEENTGGRENDSNLEDAMEAIFAAIFLDCKDMHKVTKIALKLWGKHINSIKEPPQDPKSKLQEMLQAAGFSVPKYKIIKTEGPAHEPLFTMQITVDKYGELTTTARNKKQGERELAKLMLKKIENYE